MIASNMMLLNELLDVIFYIKLRAERDNNISTHSIGRVEPATSPAITDIVAAWNGGESARVNFS